ncbi:hypothetical protein HPK19_25710 (plasmid) [Arthrobacter citreus]|uniref:AciI n=1 Tax=Arthrobacter citreus TaxID=1670 RepID=E3VX92_9MICC|nr:AciI [Arthrobacter citreus]QKE76209.1 hypothetical protein HPK19_25710 [Arthrobacter citreus]
MNEHIKGSNSHGNSNELELVYAFDGKKVKDLNTNLKNFVQFIANDNNIKINNDTKLFAKYVSNNKLKQDFIVSFNERDFYISLKMGSGNSVHQEPIEDFIKYLNTNYEVTEKICNDLRFFIWADGTLDGKGKFENRFDARYFKKNYPEKRRELLQFFEKNKVELIKHFMFVGKHNSRVDYLYHGTTSNGAWMSTKQIIDYNIQNQIDTNKGNSPTLSVGRMSIQAWNVAKSGSESAEKKRGEIQVKYGKLKEDFKEVLKLNSSNKGTLFGDHEEFDISGTLNKNKNHFYWKMIARDLNLNQEELNNLYVVRVSSKVMSSLSKKKVLPKSDAYIIRADLSKSFLLSKEYKLSEDDLVGIIYKKVGRSGISVKRADSKKYTIVKLTVASFEKCFEIEPEIKKIIAGLLLYSKEKDMYKNLEILNKIGISELELINYTNRFIVDKVISCNDPKNVDIIRSTMQERTRTLIEKNLEIKKALFMGEGWYEEPYCINYIFKDGKLSNDVFSEYIITTGSGRSKGNYTIALKPK